MDGRRSGVAPSYELGAVVHGPVLLARVGADAAVDGVAVGLRCVVAHPSGLRITLVAVAAGVHADAAQRQRLDLARRGDPEVGWSELSLVAELDGRVVTVSSQSETSSSGRERYEQETVYWIEPLPDDETIRLTVAWPQIGLGPATTTLYLPGLAAAAATTITLLPDPVSEPGRPAD